MDHPMHRWIERLALGDSHELPMWVPVGHPDPETQVQVLLEGLGDPIDVTRNNVMVDLHPFTYAISLDGEGHARRLSRARPALVVREPRPPHSVLGRIRLRFREALELPPHRIVLFETAGCANYCIWPLRRRLTYLYERARLFLDRNPHNEKMKPSEQFSNWVAYFLPRPVHLVSFVHEGRGNIFPMDLIGTTATPYYLLGLHRKRLALPPIIASGKLAVSAIPPEYTPIAFQLGKHHRVAAIEWSALPFATVASTSYGIPVPAAALAVREVQVCATREVGNHVILVTTTTHLERRATGPGMCHVHRSYQAYLRRGGRALPIFSKHSGGVQASPALKAGGSAATNLLIPVDPGG
jgi:flavin reductase (DIM6/NTAB) family NADH-FMN oxidoreductase RutF